MLCDFLIYRGIALASKHVPFLDLRQIQPALMQITLHHANREQVTKQSAIRFQNVIIEDEVDWPFGGVSEGESAPGVLLVELILGGETPALYIEVVSRVLSILHYANLSLFLS